MINQSINQSNEGIKYNLRTPFGVFCELLCVKPARADVRMWLLLRINWAWLAAFAGIPPPPPPPDADDIIWPPDEDDEFDEGIWWRNCWACSPWRAWLARRNWAAAADVFRTWFYNIRSEEGKQFKPFNPIEREGHIQAGMAYKWTKKSKPAKNLHALGWDCESWPRRRPDWAPIRGTNYGDPTDWVGSAGRWAVCRPPTCSTREKRTHCLKEEKW